MPAQRVKKDTCHVAAPFMVKLICIDKTRLTGRRGPPRSVKLTGGQACSPILRARGRAEW